MAGRDWRAWHDAYDHPGSSLAQRLRVVQARIVGALDAAPPGPLRAISLCAGQGRDLIPVLARHPRGRDVTARLVELDPGLAGAAPATDAAGAAAAGPAVTTASAADSAGTGTAAGSAATGPAAGSAGAGPAAGSAGAGPAAGSAGAAGSAAAPAAGPRPQQRTEGEPVRVVGLVLRSAARRTGQVFVRLFYRLTGRRPG